ncbi:MAG: hypothetical protein IKM62_04675 [Kiritimatiellae bacterium]|nr:hypothetical protein [Kiritimatiellia bacterium]
MNMGDIAPQTSPMFAADLGEVVSRYRPNGFNARAGARKMIAGGECDNRL